MTKRERATLVLSTTTNPLLDWSTVQAEDSRVIETRNLNLLKESLHLALRDVDVEVVRIVFDQSIDAEGWLEFLSDLPSGTRGDILFIAASGKAFLSAVGRGDERVIYKLMDADLGFYLSVFGIRDAEPAAVPHAPEVPGQPCLMPALAN